MISITLKDAYVSYTERNYKKALDLIKKAKISSEQSGVAKQLKAEIINRLALQ